MAFTRLEIDERSLGLHNLRAKLEFSEWEGLTITVTHAGTEVWSKTTENYEEGLSMYEHPFAHGFRLPEGVRA